MFSPVEIRDPATTSPTSSASRSTSKAKTSAKESSSKKGKKKANVGAGGIEEVAGSLGVGVSKSPTLVEQDPAAEPGPSTRAQAVGKNKDSVAQNNDDDDDDDMYVTEEDDCGDEGGGDGTLEASVGGQEEGVDVNPDLPPRKKRKPTRDDKEKYVVQHLGSPTATATTSMSTTPTIAAEPTIAQGQHQQGTTPTGHGISMAIDPALEALHTPNT